MQASGIDPITTTSVQRVTKALVLVLSALLLGTVLVFGQTSTADAFSTPCPVFSVQDVWADPDGNWDGDLVNNADEFLNGLQPCVPDTATFCAGAANSLCNYRTVQGASTACATALNTNPNGDFDGDGISNAIEVRNGANPCSHPCPNPRNIDVSLNPNGSWDNDAVSNALEVHQGTNPCDGYAFNPCPYYSVSHINSMPGHDWDGDGYTNLNEHHSGTNPCVFNVRRVVTIVPAPTVQRLPHVVTLVPKPVYTAPAPKVFCPAGYPHYHPGTNLCYANPVRVIY